MTIKAINLNTLHQAILNGCLRIVDEKNNLNQINFFPVADGDTGDNMASTAMAIINYSTADHSVAKTLQSIADASIIGAHGNSGMIFSQFFNGFTDEHLSGKELFIDDFSNLIRKAASSVRASILNPVEGTILTVMETWANSLEKLSHHTQCYKELLNQVKPLIDNAVADTSRPINPMQDAYEVDAGALGFSHFVNGFAEYIEHPRELPKVSAISDSLLKNQDAHPIDTNPTHRYCTEALVSAASINKKAITEILSQYGNSIVLTANSRLCRFHLHTNEPWQVFNALMDIGTINHPKVDDMQRQFESIHARKHSIAILTDSCADLPQTLRDHHQIHMISLNIHLDDHHFLDKTCFDPHTFYDTLNQLSKPPKTSFPTPFLIEEKIHHLSAQYDDVLVISMSQALSGLHNAFVNAAKKHTNVHVIDSCLGTGAQGLLVLHAAELIEKGHDIQQVIEALELKKDKTFLYVMVDKLDSLVRSGRISRFKGTIANFSNIKPILTLDKTGKGVICSRAISEKRALTKLLTILNETKERENLVLDNYCIIHAGIKEKAEAFSVKTANELRQPAAFIEAVSPAIGLHAGKGCIAIAATLK